LKKERKRLTYLFLRVFFPFSFLVAILDILVLYYYTILQEVIATANYFRLQQISTFFSSSFFFFFSKKKGKKFLAYFNCFFYIYELGCIYMRLLRTSVAFPFASKD